MKDRTLQVLAALIEDFVDTACPVASRKLLESHHLDVSSATIRNEFAKLEEIGLIESPHISAGKVPTPKGYKFFVNELLREEVQDMKLVADVFGRHIAEYKRQKTKESLFDVLKLVAQLSGNIAFATMDDDETFYIGLSNVLRSPEFLREPESVARIIEIIEGREKFLGLLDSLKIEVGPPRIFVGREDLVEEISSCSMILTRFETDYASGYVGILGPMRMRYGFNRALIQSVLEMIA